MALADNVRVFTGISPNRYDPKIMLEAACRVELDSVVIIGWDKDGELFFSASDGDGPECLWLIEKAKHALLNGGGE